DLNVAMIADRNGKPILYYPGIKQSNPRVKYVATTAWSGTNPPYPVFMSADNSNFLTAQKLELMLGANNMNGVSDGGEQPESVGDYILLGAGPDEQFGPTNNAPIAPSNPSDDVMVSQGYSR